MRNDGAIQALLGNHDLHLLAGSFFGFQTLKRDTLAHVLGSAGVPALLDWLRQQPLARTHTLAGETLLMVHVGVLPAGRWRTWSALSAKCKRC